MSAATDLYRFHRSNVEAPKVEVVSRTENCHRCGGAGGFQGWPGFTCFECRGACRIPYESREWGVPVPWTTEQAEQFLAARREAAAARRDAKALRLAATAAAERDAVLAAHPEFAQVVARVNAGENLGSFVDRVLVSATAKSLTVRQIEAVVVAAAKHDEGQAREAALAAAQASRTFFGSVGDKVTVTVTGTVRFTTSIRQTFGYRTSYTTLIVVDTEVATFKMFTASESFDAVEAGDTVTITGTVKAHEVYDGESQTTLVRPKRVLP